MGKELDSNTDSRDMEEAAISGRVAKGKEDILDINYVWRDDKGEVKKAKLIGCKFLHLAY